MPLPAEPYQYAEWRRARVARIHYHRGCELNSFTETGDGVVARFRDSRVYEGDLLVEADGSRSTVREIVLPAVRSEYAGYVAWRGLVDEPDLPSDAASVLADRFVFPMISPVRAAADLARSYSSITEEESMCHWLGHG